MIIGLSSKISGGKDTVAKIIQYLVYHKIKNIQIKDVEFVLDCINDNNLDLTQLELISTWQNKKFAGKLKEIVCILLRCTLQQLEDREFKEKELGEEWDKYELHWSDGWDGNISIVSKDFNEEDYLDKKGDFYGHLGKKISLTPRLLLQLLGTECGRNIIHPNIWVNALMNEYVYKKINIQKSISKDIPDLFDRKYPNWIISDMRFPNEMKAVKDRKGITIRIVRFQEHDIVLYQGKKCTIVSMFEDGCIVEHENETYDTFYGEIELYRPNEHESEKSLDNAEFDYTIYNIGTIEDLVEKIKQILIKEGIL